MAVRARRDLVAHRVAAGNQLRAHLAVAFPAGTGLFHDLDSPISLAFPARFGSQDAASELDEPAIGAWLQTITVHGRPADLRRAHRSRAQDRGLHHLGDPQGSRPRSRVATGGRELEAVPVSAGQDDRRGPLCQPRLRHPPANN